MARGERTATLSVVAAVVGVVASVALWLTETGYRQEQLLGLVAVVALVYFDRNPPARIAVLTFAVPAIILVDVADVFWNPTLGIVVQGALIGSLTALFAVGLALDLPRQPHHQLRAGRSRRGARDLRDPAARQGCPGWRTRLDDGPPLPGRVHPRPDRRRLPGLRGRTDPDQPVLTLAATRPHGRHDRHLPAPHRGRAVHAGLVRIQEPRPADAQPAVRHQGEHRRRVLRRQRPHGLHRRPDRADRARAVHALRPHRHRHPGRGRTVRPGVDPRDPGGPRAGDRVGHHDGARVHHRLPPRRRRRFPDRERAGGDRPRARARGGRARAHGQLPPHRRRGHRARCRRTGDHLQHRARSLRVPGALRDHRRRPPAQPPAARAAGSTTRPCRRGRPRAKCGPSPPS